MIQAKLNDTLVYNDSLVCREVNFYREAQQQWEQKAEVKANKEKFSIYLYPNPVSHQLSIMFSEETTGEIKITDALGNLIYFDQVKQNAKQRIIDLSNISAGLYFLQFSNSSELCTKKFIKQ
jgi:hypothetical protein